MNIDIGFVAKLCHEVNRAYCLGIGEKNQPPWDEAPKWQKDSEKNGVIKHLESKLTPEQSHENWMEEKISNGWKYGETKDAEKKTHPCLVPYNQLPQEQKIKDYLFKAICDCCGGGNY